MPSACDKPVASPTSVARDFALNDALDGFALLSLPLAAETPVPPGAFGLEPPLSVEPEIDTVSSADFVAEGGCTTSDEDDGGELDVDEEGSAEVFANAC